MASSGVGETISIHAPRGGSDSTGRRLWFSSPRFQSTLPVGGATGAGVFPAARVWISIHAPRGGSDSDDCSGNMMQSNFNPRSPWGERLSKVPISTSFFHFNPRSPWGERPNLITPLVTQANFNPRSPWGERPLSPVTIGLFIKISIHAPRGGSDK